MKLKNKKTGKIDNWCIDKDVIRTCSGSIVYNSLAELNEEWEDYEEPKEHWYIDWDGKLMVSTDEEGWERAIAIGNYFETKEEAEKAVENLKAWQRLKDKGFRFDVVTGCWIEFTLKSANSDEDYEQGQKDLHLLFGGEE